MIRRSTVIISLCAWTVALPSLALAQRVILPRCPPGTSIQCSSEAGPLLCYCVPITPTYPVQGMVTGLTGKGLQLDVVWGPNGPDQANVSVYANGPISLDLPAGPYSIVVIEEPQAPVQACSLTNATGVSGPSGSTPFTLDCGTAYTVGGEISGLDPNYPSPVGLSLQTSNTAAQSATFSANGPFAFPTGIADGQTYQAAVQGQPAGKNCTLVNGTGTVHAANVTNVTVSCADTGTGIAPWTLSEMQPNIKNGGRANTIAVNPNNNDNILVASESGGMFRSDDGGETWAHVDMLPISRTNAVAFVPADPKIVIATASVDYGKVNGAGVWRSADGGATWSQIPVPQAPCGISYPMEAYEISIAPDSGKIYVASTYGLLDSADNGGTWALAYPFANGCSPAIASVVSQSGGRVLVGGPAGVSRSTDGGEHWVTPTVNTPEITDGHAFGRSPFSPDQAYVVTGAAGSTGLYYTEDAGDHWTAIASAASGGGGCGGIGFVKTVGFPATVGRPAKDEIDLYFGNHCNLFKLQAFRTSGTSSFDYSGSWAQLKVDHADTRDLAFDSKGNPLLLGTDGGLHHTVDGGNDWTLVGGGQNGYNALQIVQVKGQWIQNPVRHDIYFITQDNNLWSSSDTGTTWANGDCCEGPPYIELPPHVATTMGDVVTYTSCAPCQPRTSGALFTNPTNWRNPPGALGDPITLPEWTVPQESYHVEAVGPSASLSKGLAFTSDLGATWIQFATFDDDIDFPKASWAPATATLLARPIVYAAIQSGFDTARNIVIIRLIRIEPYARYDSGSGSPGIVTYPMMNGFGGLGINTTMWAWDPVFAVDPENPNHLIAPDIMSERIMQSFDGGDNWAEIPLLTSMVTNDGQLLFSSPDQTGNQIRPIVSAVTFDPNNSNNVALGTVQNGFFVSNDSGATWGKVKDSELIPHITSFDWRTGQDLIVSSYGRGLWRATQQQNGMVHNLSNKVASPVAEVSVGQKQSPTAGKPYVRIETNNSRGNRFASPGQVIDVVAQTLPAGKLMDIKLDGGFVEKVTVNPDGSFVAQLTAPDKFGIHTITIADEATGTLTTGTMFLVTPANSDSD